MTSLNDLAEEIYDNAKDHGFWEEGVERNFGESIALAHSELSEALEEHRAGRPNVWFSHKKCSVDLGDDAGDRVDSCKPEGVAVELADALIRILDTMYSLGVDIDKVVKRKMAYNATRPYKHGKAY